MPLDIKVSELKSIILNKYKIPFFFDFKINELKVKDLINKSLNKPININFNRNSFNLLLKDGLGECNFIVNGLSSNSTIDNIFVKVAK